MKILYFACIDIDSESGVFKKIQRQADFWNKSGYETDIVIVSSKRNGLKADGIIKIEPHSIFKYLQNYYIFKYVFRIYATRKTLAAVAPHKIDIIYTRQVFWYPGFVKFTSLAPTIVEVNNNDISAISLSNKLTRFFLAKARKIYFSNVKGVVSVTKEVDKSYHRNIKLQIISNSYEIPKNLSPKAPRPPKVIFMSTPNQPWQGVDKILLLASYLNDYEFVILGWDPSNFPNIPKNVLFKGFLSGKTLECELASAGYAIGPLALHRKHMSTTSSIKVGEFLANNLPVILAYNETSIEGNFLCRIENIEANINTVSVQKIANFMNYWRLRDIDPTQLRKQIDPSIIESKRLKFFNDILALSTRNKNT